MAKESGLGARFYLNQFQFANDVQAVPNIDKSITTLDFTGIDKEAHERKAALLGGRMAYRTFINPTGAHAVVNDLPRTDVQVSYFHRATVGVPACSMVSKQTEYKLNRAESGEFLGDVDNLSNAWWQDWGLSLTAGTRTDTGATNGVAVDFSYQGAPKSFGLQAYLHVTAFTGTSATITLQGDDNVGFASGTNVTGGAFTLVTAPTYERIQTARNLAVERYLRVNTTGTFSNLQFAVMACVNETDMSAV
jgi:hypothetical protein